MIERVLAKGTLIAVVKDMSIAIELVDLFAPDHLELLVKSPRKYLRRIKHAGAVFLGPWSPEAVGDFAAGPSHVLPTGGTASMFSGLTVDDFQRRMSVIAFTRDDLKATRSVIETFGRVEQLDAHARSASIRFEKNS